MTPCEEHLTHAVFDKIAGRRLPKMRIEEFVENIKVVAEIIEGTDWRLGKSSVETRSELTAQSERRMMRRESEVPCPWPPTKDQGKLARLPSPSKSSRRASFYVARAPELDVASQGETVEQAKAHLLEAAEAFLEEAQRLGTLTEILEEASYERTQDGWKPPDLLAQERTKVALP